MRADWLSPFCVAKKHELVERRRQRCCNVWQQQAPLRSHFRTKLSFDVIDSYALKLQVQRHSERTSSLNRATEAFGKLRTLLARLHAHDTHRLGSIALMWKAFNTHTLQSSGKRTTQATRTSHNQQICEL